ncbi:MAG: histidine phosphatase family protein [Mariniphaga sp.]|jgi:phosphohistidine phosphatase|nr:histidine phosphatase family protein [Mariniphaga sp.]
MKQIFIIRHAKAVPYGYDDDFNRNLTNRGKRDAALVSGELERMGIKPDMIISSPAKRALKTARIFAENLGISRDTIQEKEELYPGLTLKEFLKLIHSLPAGTETVFFFGHNPYLQNNTTGLLKRFDYEMPTCSTNGISFDVKKWEDIEPGSGKLAFRIIPAMLR